MAGLFRRQRSDQVPSAPRVVRPNGQAPSGSDAAQPKEPLNSPSTWRDNNRVLEAVREGRAVLGGATDPDAQTRRVMSLPAASAPESYDLFDQAGNPVSSEALLLGRYLVQEEVGSGGFASVMRAFDTRIQRTVAIKCMPLDDAPGAFHQQGSILLDDQAFDAATLPGLEEARTAAKLSDSSIVQVYDFEVQGRMAYLILEYVDGITLSSLLARPGSPMTADIVAAVFKAVAHALEVAHKHQVLHLDIKPGNVLIDQQGQVKVTDFGLARLAGEAGWGAAEGGTIGYMPPEQLEQRDLDERCDEWALASLTYEMIAGANPFTVDSLDDAADAIYGAEIVIPTLCMEGLDGQTDDILFCALDPNREGRYDTVAEFAEQLLPCLGSARKGKNSLKRLVGSASAAMGEADEEPYPETEEAEADAAAYGAPEASPCGLSRRAGRVLSHLWAAACVAAVGFVACNSILSTFAGQGFEPYGWGAFAACVVLAAVFPHVGALVACVALGVALCVSGSPVAGVLFAAASVLWWWLCARRSVECAGVGLASALFGAIGIASLAPVVAALVLRPRDAAPAVLFAAALSLVFAGLGSNTLLWWDALGYGLTALGPGAQDVYVLLLQQPSTWLVVAAWALAALAGSALCRLGRRVWALIGMSLVAVVLVASQVVLPLLSSNGARFVDDPFALTSVLIAGFLGIVAAATMTLDSR